MTRQRISIILFVSSILALFAQADEALKIANAAVRIRSEFERCDVDGDHQLSLKEFAERQGDEAVLKRDFTLYDLDANSFLTRSEFASVSGLAEPSMRGRMPDPFDGLVAEAVSALDQSYDDWNLRPGEVVNAHIFVANFIGSISAGGKRYVTGRIILQADRDADGRISRREAKSFLERQLGVRWGSGPLLREPTGRLVRFNRFVDVDEDRSNGLSRGEFTARWWNRSTVERDFLLNDRDANGHITYPEFAHYSTRNFFDPVEWFRNADKNLDALLDVDELVLATTESKQRLVASTFSGFDDDNDRKLSLQEYRMSMHANVNYSWDTQPVDLDRDGRLSYDEFVFNEIDLFQLQRRYYFHRLDRDGDGRLSSSEFDFKTLRPFSIHQIAIDGTQSRQLYQSHDFPQCGWPSVSPDGKQILFHRCPPNGCADGRVVLLDVDDRNLRELCDGVNPSWSADGKWFACARTTDGEGIWIMNADVGGGQRVSDGRAPKWSPNGEMIAYLHDNGLWVYDVRRGATRELFCREDHQFQDLGGDIAWSPDGHRLAIVGNLGETSDLLIVSLNQGPHGSQKWRVRHSFPAVCNGNLSWTVQDGVIFSIQDARTDRFQLFAMTPDDESPPQRMGQFGGGHGWKSACVTPDGKWYIAVSED